MGSDSDANETESSPDERWLEDTLVDIPIPRGQRSPRNLAAGTGAHTTLPAPRVPLGARPRGKRRWLGSEINREQLLALALQGPRWHI